MTEFAPDPHSGLLLDRDATKEPLITRRRLLITGSLAAVALVAGCGEKEEKPDIFEKDPSWQQDFATMPDGPVDPTQWNIKLGPENYDGAGQQVYTDKSVNLAIRNGRLVITGLVQPMRGKPYTSARIDTLGHADFGYGRMVVRAKMPAGSGPHPAAWMRLVDTGKPLLANGKKPYGEIDIIEHIGANGDTAYNNLHTTATLAMDKGGLVTSKNTSGYDLPGMSERLIDYAVERTPDGISFFADGVQLGETISPLSDNDEDWPFGEDDRYYLILNMAIGDRWGGKAGVDESQAPWQYEVESTKFYPLRAA